MSTAAPAASQASGSGTQTKDRHAPLIPEEWIDIPSQRLYALSIGLLIQAIKLFDWLHSLVFPEYSHGLTFKWLLADIVFCLSLKKLRIPRLNYATAAVMLQIISLWLVDGVLFGSIQIGVSHYSLSSTARQIYRSETTAGRLSNIRELLIGDDHLKGEHTVRMSPISTAKLNPYGEAFCLRPPSNAVLIPILLNNTKPARIQYYFTPAGSEKTETVDVSAKELRAIEYERMESLQVSKASTSDMDEFNEADYDAEDEVELTPKSRMITSSDRNLEGTESVVYIKVHKPGVLRLRNISDFSGPNQVKIYPGEVTLVPCPHAQFVEDDISRGSPMKCLGDSQELSVEVKGIPPLSLRWHREINGRQEHFTVEKIDGFSGNVHEAHDIQVPLGMPLGVPGHHKYTLESIVDGMGNLQILGPNRKPQSDTTQDQQSPSTRSVTVLKRASMYFQDCGPGTPVSLLKGSAAALTVVARDADPKDGPWKVTIREELTLSEKGERKTKEEVYTSPGGLPLVKFSTRDPGLFQILDVRGKYCPGDILSPDTCRVVEEPYPTADVEWKTIHECSGDTGASAYLRMTGKPPFRVTYQQRRNNEPPKEMTKVFHSSRGEIVLQPESSGNYSYELLHLSDANYQKRKLNLPGFHTVVHPLASANFVSLGPHTQGAGGKRIMSSCSGDFVDVDLDLRGDGPWNVELQVVGLKGTKIIRKTGLKNNRERIRVDLPPLSEDEGNTFQLDLVSIEDSYGCKKELAGPGVTVNVRRVKPSVRFYTKDGKNHITVLEKQDARLPLRLTGEGPWVVEYRRVEPPGASRTAVVQSANDDLVVRHEGLYELLGVSDAQCPGSVTKEFSKFRVDWVPRPTVAMSDDIRVTYEKRNGSHIRRSVCEGVDDFLDLELTGRPPFQVKYNVARDSETGGTKILDTPIISSVQSRARLQLLTSEAGRIYYEVKQVGDANYPLAQNKDHVIPLNERLLFEQEVIPRPSAYFRSSTRLNYCLHDKFESQDGISAGVVVLEGRAPFYLDLSIKSLTTSNVHRQTVEISDSQWRISLPDYAFTAIGPHSVTIEAVRDSSSCPQALRNIDKKVMWVDVAESATIVPLDRREHICVGESTQFQLEGMPPWSIGYTINNKHHEQIAKQSPFVLLQQQPGEFAITSISHQNQLCKSTVNNIHFTVHPLPAAQVAHGKDVQEDIHEGSQAHIVFTLIGEPPFTFTYQRSEPPARKGGRPGKTLETHTVSGITSNEYSIYSALEGTWTVTSISDKYCRYPPVQPDIGSEK